MSTFREVFPVINVCVVLNRFDWYDCSFYWCTLKLRSLLKFYSRKKSEPLLFKNVDLISNSRKN